MTKDSNTDPILFGKILQTILHSPDNRSLCLLIYIKKKKNHSKKSKIYLRFSTTFFKFKFLCLRSLSEIKIDLIWLTAKLISLFIITKSYSK